MFHYYCLSLFEIMLKEPNLYLYIRKKVCVYDSVDVHIFYFTFHLYQKFTFYLLHNKREISV